MRMLAPIFISSLFLAACGGGKKKADTTPPPAAAEPAPAEPAPAEPAPPEPSPEEAAKAALTEQLDQGKQLFADKKCNTCHGESGGGSAKTPALVGAKALPEKAPKKAKLRKGVSFKTANDVMGFIKAKMPKAAPGTLTDDEAAALTAWILTENKVAIDTKLDASNAESFKLR